MAQSVPLSADWTSLQTQTAQQIAALAGADRSLRVPLTLLLHIDLLESVLALVYLRSLQVGFHVSTPG